MLNKVKLTEAEMREFAEVFAYYDYGDKEIGMVPAGARVPVGPRQGQAGKSKIMENRVS